MRTSILTLGLLAVACSAHATTWRVETDGTGDFTIIQDALDAAADGDTILVGAGRFDTFRPHEPEVNGFLLQIIMMVRKDLLIQGAGRDSTIIGPEAVVFEIDGRSTGCMFVDEGAEATIRGFHFENGRGFVALANKCVFEDNRIDSRGQLPASAANLSIGFSGEQVIRNCEFVGPNVHISIADNGVPNVTIEDSTFIGTDDDATAIVVRGASFGTVIQRCVFRDVLGGVQFTFGGQGEVIDCDIDATRRGVGVEVDTGTGIVRNCIIRPTRQPLSCSFGRLEVYDSIVAGGEEFEGPGYTLVAGSDVFIRNSHLGQGETGTVFAILQPGEIVDVRENWWFTTDPTEIEAAFDRSECCPDGVILFEPFALEPVSAGAESVGSFKARYRRAADDKGAPEGQ